MQDFGELDGELDGLLRDYVFGAPLAQTPRFYRASQDAFYGIDDPTFNPSDFNTTADVEKYLEGIRTSKFVKEHWPKAGNAPKPSYHLSSDGWAGDGTRIAGAAQTQIELRLLSFRKDGLGGSKNTAVHELAHLIALDEYGMEHNMAEDFNGHGRTFARINLMLVREFLGAAKADRLEQLMADYGVEVAPWPLDIGGQADYVSSYDWGTFTPTLVTSPKRINAPFKRLTP